MKPFIKTYDAMAGLFMANTATPLTKRIYVYYNFVKLVIAIDLRCSRDKSE